MGKPGCHRAKLDELLALLCVRNRVASARMISLATAGEVRSRPQNSARDRRKAGSRRHPDRARNSGRPAELDSRRRSLPEPASRKNFLFAEELRRAQLANFPKSLEIFSPTTREIYMGERRPPAKPGPPPLDSRPTKSMLSSMGRRPPAFICRKGNDSRTACRNKGPHGYAGAKARNDRTREVMSEIASAADQRGIQEG